MLRYLALLIVCVAAVLALAGPSMAYAGRAIPTALEHDTVRAELTAAPADDGECPSRSGGCQVICAPSHLPLPARQNGFARVPPKSPQLPVLDPDCLRPIILGRDPPVPRHRLP